MATDTEIQDLETAYIDREAAWTRLLDRSRAAADRHRQARQDAARACWTAMQDMKSARAGQRMIEALNAIPRQSPDLVRRLADAESVVSHPSRHFGLSPRTVRTGWPNPLGDRRMARFEAALLRGNYIAAQRIMERARPTGLRRFFLFGAAAAVDADVDRALAFIGTHKAARDERDRLSKHMRESDRQLASLIRAQMKNGRFPDLVRQLARDGHSGIAETLQSCLDIRAGVRLPTVRQISAVLDRSRGDIDTNAWIRAIAGTQERATKRHERAVRTLDVAEARFKAADLLSMRIVRQSGLELRTPENHRRVLISSLLNAIRTDGGQEARRDEVFKLAQYNFNRRYWADLNAVKESVDAISRPGYDPADLKWRGGHGLTMAALEGWERLEAMEPWEKAKAVFHGGAVLSSRAIDLGAAFGARVAQGARAAAAAVRSGLSGGARPDERAPGPGPAP